MEKKYKKSVQILQVGPVHESMQRQTPELHDPCTHAGVQARSKIL